MIKELDHDARANYSQALLTCSVNRRLIAACPLAFGEIGVKDRVKCVLNYKKPAFWLIIVAVVACVAVAVCFLTNPQQRVKDILVPNTSWRCEDYDLTFQIDQNYVIEGEINLPNYSGKISIGYRYAGRNAVAEIFKGDWEYAQGAVEEPLLSGEFLTKNGKLMLKIKEDNVGLNQNELSFTQTTLGNDINLGASNLIYGFVPPASDSDKLSYIYISDFGCDVKDATINFEKARFEDGKMIFDIHWTNDGSENIDISPDFEVYKYNGSKREKLEQLGYWNLYREMLAGKGMTADDGFVFEHQRATSYNLSAHYDVLTPGKYRFEAHGAWVEFQIIDNFNMISAVYDTATFDVDNDGKEENCSLFFGRTSGLFTFIFFVQDKETGDVENETTIYSQVYELSFQKGADGKMKVQGITQGENPETHLFDISIRDGYVYLTENGFYIGGISEFFIEEIN